ncbi:pilus assembly protein PilP [Thaumasiovibrio sp. DFM-14]|uniref:pilus assembly protein PilP n=1 Tax=Thaumasiovibrio sp. DFM-14 TaxID=3384792 RepID=UPI0039A00993
MKSCDISYLKPLARRGFGFGLLCAVVLLSGCRANNEPIAPLVKQIRARATAKVEALPLEFTYTPLAYEVTTERQPFAKPVATRLVANTAVTDCWQPNMARHPESLEQYSLDTLAVKGVIGDKSDRWALIQTPEGKLERIKTGQFMGLNRGLVQVVDAFGIEVQESLPDGLGCWQQRSLKLAVNQPVSVSQ